MNSANLKNYPIDEILQKKSWSLPDAFRYCIQLARTHYENFPVGSALIPKKLQPYVCSIYAFARRADDIADEDFPEEDRIPALDAWLGLLEEAVRQRRSNHPVFMALRETIRRFDIPVQLLVDLITAFKMDVEIKRHPTFEDVLYYCRHSANPVGRLVLHLFGYRDESLLLLSDQICTALQLANFWQDVAVDLKKNRIYIPLEDMERYHYSEGQLFAHEFNSPFKELLKFQVDRTESMFRNGTPLIYKTRGRLRLELKCVIIGGMTILKMIRGLDYNTLATRPHLKNRDKAVILAKAVFAFKRTVFRERITAENESKSVSPPAVKEEVSS